MRLFDASTWAAIVSAVAACLATIFAFWSVLLSKKALRISERQEQRYQPTLVPYLIKCYVKYLEHGRKARLYAFLLSISNRSDADNSIAQLDLNVKYSVGGIPMPLKISSDPNVPIELTDNNPACLTIPIRVDAHQTITGWSYFRVNESLLEKRDIEGYSLIITDSHGHETPMQATIIQELSYETKTKNDEVADPK